MMPEKLYAFKYYGHQARTSAEREGVPLWKWKTRCQPTSLVRMPKTGSWHWPGPGRAGPGAEAWEPGRSGAYVICWSCIHSYTHVSLQDSCSDVKLGVRDCVCLCYNTAFHRKILPQVIVLIAWVYAVSPPALVDPELN